MKGTRGERRGEIRAVADDGNIEVMAIAYGVVDEYGSLWQPGVFTDDLKTRLPVFAFGHDWSDPIGRATSSKETDEGLILSGPLDIGTAVPRADQVHAQMKSGTLTDVSVGFYTRERRDPNDAERKQYPEVREVIEKADLDEVSVVLRGAVPGAKVLAVRSARAVGVDFDDVVEIAKRKAAGELSDDEAEAALALLASEPSNGNPEPEVEGSADEDAEPDPLIDEAAEIIDRSR